MKYNVGDKVRIKSLDWYNENKDENDNVLCFENIHKFTSLMSLYCGEVVTISNNLIGDGEYLIKEDGELNWWTDDMIEGLAEEEMIDLTSVVMEIVEEKSIQNALSYGYNLPEGYIFKDENGNVINAMKIVLEKKKKEYPKSFEECCKVLGTYSYNQSIVGYKNELFSALQKLLICRDAYWKIAGEEMGLGKPWEPDCTSGYFIPAIIYWSGFIQKVEVQYRNAILIFPTEEMRDAFYENFKELIESVKELL